MRYSGLKMSTKHHRTGKFERDPANNVKKTKNIRIRFFLQQGFSSVIIAVERGSLFIPYCTWYIYFFQVPHYCVYHGVGNLLLTQASSAAEWETASGASPGCVRWSAEDGGWIRDSLGLDTLRAESGGATVITCRAFHLSAFSSSLEDMRPAEINSVDLADGFNLLAQVFTRPDTILLFRLLYECPEFSPLSLRTAVQSTTTTTTTNRHQSGAKKT